MNISTGSIVKVNQSFYTTSGPRIWSRGLEESIGFMDPKTLGVVLEFEDSSYALILLTDGRIGWVFSTLLEVA